MKLVQKKMLLLSGECLISGVKGIFTMHGKTMEDVKKNELINNLIENKQIEKIFFL